MRIIVSEKHICTFDCRRSNIIEKWKETAKIESSFVSCERWSTHVQCDYTKIAPIDVRGLVGLSILWMHHHLKVNDEIPNTRSQ